MTATSYLRRSLLIPILAPVVAWMLGVILPSNVTVIAAFAFIGAALYFGLPYLGVAALAALWSRGRTEGALRRCAWVAPVQFAPLAGWSYGHAVPAMQGASGGRPLSTTLMATFVALLLGYGYTLVVVFSLDALKRRGRIDGAPMAGGA